MDESSSRTNIRPSTRAGRNGKRVSMTALETETGNAFLVFFCRFLFLGSQKRHFFAVSQWKRHISCRFWAETAFQITFLSGNVIFNAVSEC
jgi:hypothetical protein